MRYLIISDLHGGAENTEKALAYFKPFHCDAVVLLGDVLNHGPRNGVPPFYDPKALSASLNAYAHCMIAIRGNCDSEVDGMMLNFPLNAAYGWLTVSRGDKFKRIFLTHGHLHDFKTTEGIAKLGLKPGDIVLSGHTHVAGVFQLDNGIINVNPGSLTFPKKQTKAGFGILDDENITLYDLEHAKPYAQQALFDE